jgi:hypothetical protein
VGATKDASKRESGRRTPHRRVLSPHRWAGTGAGAGLHSRSAVRRSEATLTTFLTSTAQQRPIHHQRNGRPGSTGDESLDVGLVHLPAESSNGFLRRAWLAKACDTSKAWRFLAASRSGSSASVPVASCRDTLSVDKAAVSCKPRSMPWTDRGYIARL